MLKLVSFSDEHASRLRYGIHPASPGSKKWNQSFSNIVSTSESISKIHQPLPTRQNLSSFLSKYLISTVGRWALHHYVFSLWAGESDGPRNDLSPSPSHCTPSVLHPCTTLHDFIRFRTSPHSSGKKFSKTKLRSLSFLIKGTAPSLGYITWRFSNSFLL